MITFDVSAQRRDREWLSAFMKIFGVRRTCKIHAVWTVINLTARLVNILLCVANGLVSSLWVISTGSDFHQTRSVACLLTRLSKLLN